MAKAKNTRLYEILERMSSGGSLSSADLTWINRQYNSDAAFRDWYDTNYGQIMSLTSGRVRDAKDAYGTYGFTPYQNSRTSGPGTNAMILRSGMRTNQRSGRSDAKVFVDGRSQSAGGRIRTKAETASIYRRGMAGASLSLEDQSIFDRLRTIERENAESAANERQRQEAQRTLKKQRADKFQLLGMRDDGTLNDLQVADLVAQREARAKTNEELYKQGVLGRMELEASEEKARRADEAKRIADEAKRRQVETDNGRTPDMTDEDYAEWMNKGGPKFAKWDYSDRDRQEIEDARGAIRRKLNDGTYNGFEAVEANRQLDDQIANGRWKKRVSERSDVPSGEPPISKDGRFYASDRKWIPLPKVETPEDREKRTTQAQKNRLIDKLSTTYMKEVQGEFDENPGKPLYTYKQALEKAKRDAEERYPDKRDYGRYPFLGDENFKEDAKTCPICGSHLYANGYCAECDYQEDAGQTEYDATATGGYTEPPDEADAANEVSELPAASGSHIKASYT